MKLIKCQHACFVLESDGQMLVVDPGNLTTDLAMSADVSAIVVTHQHPDHADLNLLTAIAERNPQAKLYAHQSVIDALGYGGQHQAVDAGDIAHVGPFELEFYGGEHAIIHSDLPPLSNLGVVINHQLAYPGDALVNPPQPVAQLLLPIAAPWCKISEVIDFARSSGAKQLFPTHDAVLSAAGKQIYDRVISANLLSGQHYRRLDSSNKIGLDESSED